MGTKAASVVVPATPIPASVVVIAENTPANVVANAAMSIANAAPLARNLPTIVIVAQIATTLKTIAPVMDTGHPNLPHG